MVVLAPLLLIGGIALFCWLIFSVAIYALPVMSGIAVMLWAMAQGSGAVIGIVAGLLSGGLVLALAQALFAHAHSVRLRFAVALVFAAPAVVAGYGATLGLSQLVVASSGWQTAIAVIGAVMVGGAAWVRIVATPPAGASLGGTAGHRPARGG